MNEKLQFTVETFFPLSLSFKIVGPGHVRVGDLKSDELKEAKVRHKYEIEQMYGVYTEFCGFYIVFFLD